MRFKNVWSFLLDVSFITCNLNILKKSINEDGKEKIFKSNYKKTLDIDMKIIKKI